MELSGEKLQDREGESAETRPRNEVSSSGRESRSRPLRLDPGGCYSEWKLKREKVMVSHMTQAEIEIFFIFKLDIGVLSVLKTGPRKDSGF